MAVWEWGTEVGELEAANLLNKSGIVAGKKFLVTGVLTDQSIAFHIARLIQEEGGEVVLSSFGRPHPTRGSNEGRNRMRSNSSTAAKRNRKARRQIRI